MLYKIELDETQRETVNVLIRLPGVEGHDLHLSFRLNGSSNAGYTPASPALPLLATAVELTECQDSLASLIKHLVTEGRASYAGKYKKGAGKIPLFRSDSTGGLYVDSVDKKTGQHLLKGIHLKNPDKVKKLANWIVSKFPVVSAWAGVAYNSSPKDAEQLACIITMAARVAQANATLTASRHG
jgi:hypothetical protein